MSLRTDLLELGVEALTGVPERAKMEAAVGHCTA